MKTAITLVWIVLAFYVKSLECTFDLSETEKALNHIKVKGDEALFRNVNGRKISKYNQEHKKVYHQNDFFATSNRRGGRSKRKGCDPPEFVLPAIPRLRYISAKNVPSPLVVTASTYIWKPLDKKTRRKRSFCGFYPRFTETSHLEIKRALTNSTNNSSSDNNTNNSSSDNNTNNSSSDNKTNNSSSDNKPLKKKKIGLGKKKLFQTASKGKKKSKQCDDGGPYKVTHNIWFKASEKSKGGGEDSSNNPSNPLAPRMFTDPTQNGNFTNPELNPKKKLMGRKLSDKLSALQNETLVSNKLKGMHELPEKSKTAQKNDQVDMGYKDSDDALQVLNDLMKRFLTSFRSKSPSVAKKMNEALKKFILFRLLEGNRNHQA